ncbi:MAG: leucine-rich repeat domain-containing protein [Bacteroidaceae bacterium]|nr:leucine-rich repeat domain-containing protein [Bacteroidaceae bacterium]
MAKKPTIDELESFEQDWNGNCAPDGRGRISHFEPSSDGLPFSGLQIEQFLKLKIQEALNARAGASFFVSATSTLYNFRDAADRQQWLNEGQPEQSDLIVSSCIFNFTGTVYQYRILGDSPTGVYYYTVQQQEALVSVSVLSQRKAVTDIEWSDTREDSTLQIAVDTGAAGKWNTIMEGVTLRYGDTFTFDVRRWLANGRNRIRVMAVGSETHEQTSAIYDATLTSMYLAADRFNWWAPFIEGRPYSLGGLNIGGAVSKTLHIRVRGDGYTPADVEVNLGTQTYTENEYFYPSLTFPETGSGIYTVEMWVTSDTLATEHVRFSIICVAAGDVLTARLAVMNNIAGSLVNGAANDIFSYALYDGESAVAAPVTVNASVRLGGQTSYIVEDDIIENQTTSQPHVYSHQVEVASDSSELTAHVTIEVDGGNTAAADIAIDNAASYPATPGATLYINPANRSNRQHYAVNEVDGSRIAATWDGIAWVDGTDGWTADEAGRRCLLVPAGARPVISWPLLGDVGNARTVELTFAVRNASDYDEPVIAVMDDLLSAAFRGLRIRPEQVTLHSNDLSAASGDLEQSYTFKEGERVNVIVTLTRNYKGNYGNLAQIYVNGAKKCQFAYGDNDVWSIDAPLVLGSSAADLYLYGVRCYNRAFGSADAFANYVASLPTQADKQLAYATGRSVVDDGWHVDYDAVSREANVMVIEIAEPEGVLPAWGMDKKYATKSNVEFRWHDRPADSLKIFGVETSGQGTTSMNYYRWNLRFRIDKSNDAKKCPVSYWDVSSGDWGEPADSKTARFRGADYPALKRITAKKNVASSMQGHKMGTTAAYNDLHDIVAGPNEAGGRTAIYMEPVYGFVKEPVEGAEGLYSYRFIGLFTVGPDKGDKPTFKWDDERFSDTLMSLEGLDHSVRLTTFRYPWNSDVRYVGEEEALCVVKGVADYEAGWEAGNFRGLDTDKTASEDAVTAAMEQYFKPAYEVAYRNSTLILGTTSTLADINADVAAWEAQRDTATGRLYQYYEFWLDGEGPDRYKLCYHDIRTGRYEFSGVSMLDQYVSYGGQATDLEGLTTAEKNELFREARRGDFLANWEQYWDKRDALFHLVFLQIFGATDNFAKNSYPYCFGGNGCKWRWRQDDLDTIFDIDNQGHSRKPYSIEMHDFLDDSRTGYVFRGEDSVFWTLVGECCADECRQTGRDILGAMYAAGSGTTVMERLMGFFEAYYWGKAQRYFTKTAYNNDAEYTYEDAWKNGAYVASVDTHPLAQSLGDHLEAERRWVELRMLYCMSLYRYGPFAAGSSDASLGRLSYRPLAAETFTLTPAFDLYPAILIGQNSRVGAASRVMAGEPVTLTGPAGADTNIYIVASDYLTSIGDLSKTTAAALPSISGKRLRVLKLGDADALEVTSQLSSVGIGDCPSLKSIDARNLPSLASAVDLSGCPRLREALFAGTSVTNITLPEGSKITTLSLPSTISAIILRSVKRLTNLSYSSLAGVVRLEVEDAGATDAVSMLASIFNSEGQRLQLIRVTNFTWTGNGTLLDALSAIAANKDKDGNSHTYKGLTADGLETDVPVIQGDITVDAAYEDSIGTLESTFQGLHIDAAKLWIRFADPVVSAVALANWDTDHDGGITSEEAAAVTTLSSLFNGNTSLVSFDELSRFTGIATLGEYTFNGCTSLRSVELPQSVTVIRRNVFYGCISLSHVVLPSSLLEIYENNFLDNTALTSVELPSSLTLLGASLFSGCTNLVMDGLYLPNVTQIERWAFRNCTGLTGDVRLPSLTTLGVDDSTSGAFENTGISRVLDLGSVVNTSPGNRHGTFEGCLNLTEATLPSTVRVLGARTFAGCTSLRTVNVDWTVLTAIGNDLVDGGGNVFLDCANLEINGLYLPNVTRLGYGAFRGCTKVTGIVNMPALQYLNAGDSYSDAFYGSGITKVASLGNITDVSPGTRRGMFQNCTSLAEVSLPLAATRIGTNAFSGCTSLTTINLPASLTEVASGAFEGCTLAFENVSLSLPNLTMLGGSAFKGTKVKSVSDLGAIQYLGGSETENGGDVFLECLELEHVTLPSTLHTIKNRIFKDCTYLQTVTVLALTPPALGWGVFDRCASLAHIYVPAASVTAYQTASGWSDYAAIIEALQA